MHLSFRIFLTRYFTGVVEHVGKGEIRNSSRLLEQRWHPCLDREEELLLLLGLVFAALLWCSRIVVRTRLDHERWGRRAL